MDSIIKKDVPAGSISVWDIFSLDSFNKKLGLDVDHIIRILDRFSGNLDIQHLDIQADIVTALYEHMGGNKDTPPTEIMAFMFVLLNSPNFRFLEFCTMMIHACYADSTLRYLREMEVKTPPSYIQNMYDNVANIAVNNILNSRHIISLDPKIIGEEAEQFGKDISDILIDYYSGGSALDAFPDIFSQN